jgi:chemotaxis protein MotB
MAGDAKKLQPIIIKKIKKGGHAAHGGAWKIAYADFVTAMMAFFLLMWLLGSTTEGDKKGIADFFGSPLKVAMGGGSGSGDSSHIIKGGGTDLSRSNGQVKNGDVEAPRRTINLQAMKEQQAAAEKTRLNAVRDKVEAMMSASPKLSEFKTQIKLDMTRDGLRIQIVDDQKRAMFDSGSAMVQPYMREILRAVGQVLTEVPNKLTIEGHTDALRFGNNDMGYTNWELSSDRANSSRRELIAGGLADSRILRVQGLAASVPYDRKAPTGPVNRRISIIVMTRDAEDRFFQSGDLTDEDIVSSATQASAPTSSPPTSGR